FRELVRRRVAMRASYLCSNPQCGANTVGPGRGAPDAVVNVGIAAHITAAAPGGPRYDDTLTAEQRSHITNAIWLCATCSHLIDADAARFDVAMLHDWKRLHEEQMGHTLLGRYAAFDAEQINRLATTTGNSARLLEEIVPLGEPPDSELSFRASA